MVYYTAHPLGTGLERTANIARAKRWLAWLLKTYPDDAFVLPWVPYAEVLPDCSSSHTRGLRDDLDVLARLDGICLVGGKLSPGMLVERNYHIETRVEPRILNLLHLGAEPPKD